MQQKDLERFRDWFNGFVAGYYGEDEYVNANLKLKEDHTRRVCVEMVDLARGVGLDKGGVVIAEAIALLHDVGRFEQFLIHRTYNDPRSENHCLLGLKVLRQHDVLAGLGQRERQMVETAIRLHGNKRLPDGLDEETEHFSRLIRDADKLDIYYVVTENCKRFDANPDDYPFELEFSDEPRCSRPVVDGVLGGQLLNYDQVHTQNDFKLLQLGWVYDVNFSATLRRIRDRQYLPQILARLPRTEDIVEVGRRIFRYVDGRIDGESL